MTVTLSQAQVEVRDAIATCGELNGYSDEQIQIAINVAYIESSLGLNLSNPSSTASGLFQYLDGHLFFFRMESDYVEFQRLYPSAGRKLSITALT
ncbi:hypothetical protein [Pseudomonas lopnurensis]|uniref:hypothetical protein n=1 Tax=Pseudomonas lopnurensis TaxID=1477517 RepID=UPI0028A9B461|nr:hypothetical protein [Pseudomonas lopnurensis]